jgi:hypothetical protein
MNLELQKIERYLISLGFSPDTFTELSKSNGGKVLVTNSNTAFCFDKISAYFYSREQLNSVDALLLKDNLYLIEFKVVSTQLSVTSQLQSVISHYQSVVSHLSQHQSIVPQLQSAISKYKSAISQLKSLIPNNQSIIPRLKSMISQLKEINNLPEKNLKLSLFQKMTESIHTLRECIYVNSGANPDKFEKHFILVTEDAVQAISTSYRHKSRNKSAKNTVPSVAAGDVFKDSFEKYQQEYKNAPKNNRIKVYYDSIDVWATSEFPKRIVHLK